MVVPALLNRTNSGLVRRGFAGVSAKTYRGIDRFVKHLHVPEAQYAGGKPGPYHLYTDSLTRG